MYVCLECYNTFEDLVEWEEKHGLDTPPYEHFVGSPCCYGNFTEALMCNCCGHPITTEGYIKTDDGERFCEDCFRHMELGEE